MAVVKGPLFSLDASGSVAGAITFSKWKGRAYVRQRVIPSNPKTGGQLGRRAMMRFLAQKWDALVAGDKASWTTLAAQIVASNFNAYVRDNLQYWHNFKPPSQNSERLALGSTSDNVLTAAAWEQNRIKLSFLGSALGDAWGKIIYAALGAAVVPAVGTAVLIEIDDVVTAHDVYWTPHIGDVDAQWTFDSMTFSDDGVISAAGGPQSTS